MSVHISPPPLSTQSIADLLCTLMVLCRGQGGDGKRFWAYLCIKPSMARAFKEAREKGNFNIEEFGTVIESGEGSEVPSDVKKRMERDYGMNHSYESQLIDAINHLRDKQGL